MVTRSVIACLITFGAFTGTAMWYRARRSLSIRLLLVATGCFVVVALAHLCEATQLLVPAGWGQPHSLGHYLDLLAAWLGMGFLAAAAVLVFRPPRARSTPSHTLPNER